MRAVSNTPKVAVDMFYEQMQWTRWYLGVILVIHIIEVFFKATRGGEVSSFFVSVAISSSNIYMLVIGIIAGLFFLPYYVQNGVTRKDQFYGAAIAMLGLAAAITLISLIVSLIEVSLVKIFNLPVVFESISGNLAETDAENNLLAAIIFFIVLAPFVSPDMNLLLSMLLVILNMVFYYLMGWLITAAFYRYNRKIGFAYIALTILLFFIKGVLWGDAEGLLAAWPGIQIGEPHIAVSFGGTIALICIGLWILRLLTRDVSIRM